MPQCIHRFRFGGKAIGAGIGLPPRCRAGGLCGNFPRIPIVAEFHNITVECGLAFPRNGTDVLTVFQVPLPERFIVLTAQGIAYHIRRHSGNQGEHRGMRVAVIHTFGSDLQRVIPALRNRENVLPRTSPCGGDRTASHVGQSHAGNPKVAGFRPFFYRQHIAFCHVQGKHLERQGGGIRRRIVITPVSLIPSGMKKILLRHLLIRHGNRTPFRAPPLIQGVAVRGHGVTVICHWLPRNGACGQAEVAVRITFYKIPFLCRNKVPRLARQRSSAFRLGNQNAAGCVTVFCNRKRCSPGRNKIVRNNHVIIFCLGNICGRNVNIRRPERFCCRMAQRGAPLQAEIAKHLKRLIRAGDRSAGNEKLRIACLPESNPGLIFRGNFSAPNVDAV